MKEDIFKRALGIMLAFLMLFSALPANAFVIPVNAAEITNGLCEHHVTHEDCSFVEAVAGQPCAHAGAHDENCGYREGMPGVPCDHVHGGEECGTPVVSYPECGHVCTDGQCAFVAEIAGTPCDHNHQLWILFQKLCAFFQSRTKCLCDMITS